MAKAAKRRKSVKTAKSAKKKKTKYFPPGFRIELGSGGFRAARKK